MRLPRDASLVVVTHTATDAITTFEEWEAQAQHKEPAGEGAAEGQEAPEPPQVVVVGRLRLRRPGGKVTFAHVEDESGRVQLFFRFNDLPEPPNDSAGSRSPRFSPYCFSGPLKSSNQMVAGSVS